MDLLDHDLLNKLIRYCVGFTHQLEILKKKTPNINKNELCKMANGMVKTTRELIDSPVRGGAKVSDPISKDSCMWLLFANMLLLIAMTVFIMNMWHSILDLESKVFPTGRMFVEEGK